jgi:hypothetical protein
MNSKEGSLRKKQFAKRSEVRTIAKAAGHDSDELTTWCDQPDRKRDERSIKIRCVQTGALYETPFP